MTKRTENSSSTSNSGRIKWASRIAKWWIIACAVYTLRIAGMQCLSVTTFGIPKVMPQYLGWLSIAATLVTIAWYGFLARLFHLYERGIFFRLQNTRCIKALGLIFIVWWMVGIPLTRYEQQTQTRMARAYANQTAVPAEQLHEVLVVRTRFSNHGLFGMDVGWGLNFHILGAGIVILLIAWIMEEGCRLREDQELTV